MIQAKVVAEMLNTLLRLEPGPIAYLIRQRASLDALSAETGSGRRGRNHKLASSSVGILDMLNCLTEPYDGAVTALYNANGILLGFAIEGRHSGAYAAPGAGEKSVKGLASLADKKDFSEDKQDDNTCPDCPDEYSEYHL